MSYGSDLLALAPSATVGVGTGLLNSIIGAFTQKRAAKQQFKYNQALMQQQHEYELQNMSELERLQRGLALDSYSLKRRGLEAAGYSAADPDNQGASIGAVSPTTSAHAGFSMPSPPGFTDLSSNISNIAAARNISSQTALNEIEAKYKAQQMQSEIDYTNSRIEQIQELLQPQKDNLMQDLINKRKEVNLKDEQINEIQHRIDNLVAATAGIRIDNKYKDQLNENTINRIHAETVKLVHEGNIKGIEAELARVGILVDANWMTQLLAVMHLGSGTEVLQDIASTISTMMSSLPGALSQVLSSVIDALASAVVNIPKSVWEKIRSKISF